MRVLSSTAVSLGEDRWWFVGGQDGLPAGTTLSSLAEFCREWGIMDKWRSPVSLRADCFLGWIQVLLKSSPALSSTGVCFILCTFAIKPFKNCECYMHRTMPNCTKLSPYYLFCMFLFSVSVSLCHCLSHIHNMCAVLKCSNKVFIPFLYCLHHFHLEPTRTSPTPQATAALPTHSSPSDRPGSLHSPSSGPAPVLPSCFANSVLWNSQSTINRSPWSLFLLSTLWVLLSGPVQKQRPYTVYVYLNWCSSSSSSVNTVNFKIFIHISKNGK